MLSIPHLIIIFVVALVVFGPEKLPELARNLGKVMAEFRRATGDLRSTFEGHMRDLEREADTRRIGGGAPTQAQASPILATVPPPTETSAPGTVPTLPPQVGAPIEGQQAASTEVDQEVRFQPAQIEPLRPSAAEESANAGEHSAETTTDGGTRPA
jgi:TatA/E family protein of Tat protein translocase